MSARALCDNQEEANASYYSAALLLVLNPREAESHNLKNVSQFCFCWGLGLLVHLLGDFSLETQEAKTTARIKETKETRTTKSKDTGATKSKDGQRSLSAAPVGLSRDLLQIRNIDLQALPGLSLQIGPSVDHLKTIERRIPVSAVQ